MFYLILKNIFTKNLVILQQFKIALLFVEVFADINTRLYKSKEVE